MSAPSSFEARSACEVERIFEHKYMIFPLIAILLRLARIRDLTLSLGVFNALWPARVLSPAESDSNISIIMSRAVIAGQRREIEQVKFLHALSNFFYHHGGLTWDSILKHNVKWVVYAGWEYISFHPTANTRLELDIKMSFLCGNDDDSEALKSFILDAMAEYTRYTANFSLCMIRLADDYPGYKILDLFLLAMKGVLSLTVNPTSLDHYNRDGRQ